MFEPGERKGGFILSERSCFFILGNRDFFAEPGYFCFPTYETQSNGVESALSSAYFLSTMLGPRLFTISINSKYL